MKKEILQWADRQINFYSIGNDKGWYPGKLEFFQMFKREIEKYEEPKPLESGVIKDFVTRMTPYFKSNGVPAFADGVRFVLEELQKLKIAQPSEPQKPMKDDFLEWLQLQIKKWNKIEDKTNVLRNGEKGPDWNGHTEGFAHALRYCLSNYKDASYRLMPETDSQPLTYQEISDQLVDINEALIAKGRVSHTTAIKQLVESLGILIAEERYAARNPVAADKPE